MVLKLLLKMFVEMEGGKVCFDGEVFYEGVPPFWGRKWLMYIQVNYDHR